MKWVCAAVLFAILFFGCMGGEKRATIALPDGFTINPVLAKTQEQRARGLMGVATLGEKDGMLFYLVEPRTGFWTRGMLIPIDIVFLDVNMTVVDVFADAQPCEGDACRQYYPHADSRYALEIAANSSARHGIAQGTRLAGTGME